MDKKFNNKIKLVVIKAGTSILASKDKQLNLSRIGEIAEQIVALLKQNVKVILVSSGAIGAGMSKLKLNRRPHLLPKLQAAAAVGQIELMKIYESFFGQAARMVAQILLTADDFTDRRRYLNTKNTLLTLLDYGVVPVINENDTVSTDEIKFGDNDKLSAQVANLICADLLIILSDVDGLYDQNKRRIKVIKEISAKINDLAGDTTGKFSVGGMATKIEAAKITTSSGIPCIIANGKKTGVISKVMKGEDAGTVFMPHGGRMVAKKCWIAFTSRCKGKISVDKGAEDALLACGRSLLPSGVKTVEGKFKAGDIISIADAKGEEFARGMSNYSASELDKIKGCRSSLIESKLGYKYYDEVIHRNNLVVLKKM